MTSLDRRRRLGAQRKGGVLLAVDDEATARLERAEVGEVVRGQLRGDVALEAPGVLRRAVEDDLGARVRRDRIAELLAELAERLMREHEAESVAAGLGEHVGEAAGKSEEVLALVEIEAGETPDPPRLVLAPVASCQTCATSSDPMRRTLSSPRIPFGNLQSSRPSSRTSSREKLEVPEPTTARTKGRSRNARSLFVSGGSTAARAPSDIASYWRQKLRSTGSVPAGN